MGRIAVALALVIGWTSVAHATAQPCMEGTITFGDRTIERGQLVYGRIEPRWEDSTDRTPPAAPKDVRVKGSLFGDGLWDELSFPGTYASDTAFIRLNTEDGYSLITTPDRTSVCSGGLNLRSQTHVSIIAYDKAGNASAPFEADINVEGARERHHYRCGTGAFILLLGSVVMAGGMFLVLVLIGFVRKRAPASVAGEFVSPILAENVARIVARGYAMKLFVATLATTGLWTFGHPFMAIISGPFVLVWFIELVMSRSAVGQFDKPVQRLEKRENWIYINSTKLYAPRRAWEKASALPSAAVLD